MPPPPSGFPLAVAHYRQGQLDLAERHCLEGLKAEPRNPAGLQLLGVIELRLDKPQEALDAFDRLVALGVSSPDALVHRGLALQQLQRFDEALASIDKALALRPGYAEGLNNRGAVLKDMERLPEALESIDRALQLAPQVVSALCNRGAVLRDLGRYDEALAAFDQALALEPASRDALNLKGRLLYFLRRLDQAAETFQQLIRIDPARPYLRGLIFELRLGACDWRDYDASVSEMTERIQRGEPTAEHPLNFAWYTQSAAAQARCTELFARREWPAPKQPLPPAAPRAHAKIRLAYFSPDFREHPISYVFAGLVARHDRSKFDVHALSFGASDGSAMRARLETIFDRFHDVRQMPDRALAEFIRAQEIDILVDLAGFTASNRGKVLALRPAPIAVNFQGFGIGAPFIDYLISDARSVPKGHERFYREKIVRMPDSWVVTDNTEAIAEDTPSRASQGLPGTGFVFCSFNGANKINPAMFAAWMRLLKSVEGSALWLRHDNDIASANLRREAERQGVAGERLAFARRVGLPEHLARHRLADLFLDSYPYGAHTTASHALWAGLPVLTMRGETFVSRVGASLIHALGMPEMIVESLADYEAMALKLAREPAQLAAARARLAEARKSSALFDTDRYVRHIESAYLSMMERLRGGEPPTSFDVKAL